GFITDILTQSAIGFVKANKERPFFLYIPYNVPHEPHIIDDAHYQKYAKKGLTQREARIYGLVTQCDTNIGRVLKTIDEQGLRDNTIVIFLSDNGGISKHYTAGLRGAKASVYEGGTRVPCFIRWPGHFTAGRKVDAMASHLDLFPTLCELTGAKPPQDRPIDGRSLMPLLTGKSSESQHDFLFHIWDRQRPTPRSKWAVTGRRYKLVGAELYDLQNDPGEKRNIAAANPEVAREMRGQFDTWFADVTRGKTFQPAPIEVGGPYENPIDLLASWAHIRGTSSGWSHTDAHEFPEAAANEGKKAEESTNYTFAAYDWDTIDTWRKPGESAHWNIHVATAGEYEVTLVYGCDREDAGGEFQVTVGAARLSASVHGTPSRNIFEPHVLGKVKLPKGPAKLEVRVLSAPGKELMTLNRVRLLLK
ncbi:MAG: sulfatase-like hydrolase/transferase, partial [Bryobacteraceae bacterium]